MIGGIQNHSDQSIWGKYTILKGSLPKEAVHPDGLKKILEDNGLDSSPAGLKKCLSMVGELELFNADLYFQDQAEEQQRMAEEASIQRTKDLRTFAEKGYRIYPLTDGQGNVSTYCMEVYGYNISVDLGPQGNKLSEAALLGRRAQAMQIGRPWEHPDNIKRYPY